MVDHLIIIKGLYELKLIVDAHLVVFGIYGVTFGLNNALREYVKDGLFPDLKAGRKAIWFDASRKDIKDFFRNHNQELHEKYGKKMDEFMKEPGYSQRMVDWNNQINKPKERGLEGSVLTTN